MRLKDLALIVLFLLDASFAFVTYQMSSWGGGRLFASVIPDGFLDNSKAAAEPPRCSSPPTRPLQVVESEQFLDLLSMSVKPTTEIVLVLVGVPGCGKSTFARQIVSAAADGKWCVACQDVEGDRRKVERLVVEVLEGKGKSGQYAGHPGRVIVDRCNFDAQQRKHWIDIAIRRQVAVPDVDLLKLCLVLPHSHDLDFCTARAVSRGDDGVHAGEEDWPRIVSRMVSQYRKPDRRLEGFDAIYWCDSAEELEVLGAALASLP